MMKRIKPYIFFFALMLIFLDVHVKAQVIRGDTIYVDAKAEIAIRFPGSLTDFNTIPNVAPYNIKTFENGVTIIAMKKNTATVPFYVTESKRTHQFFIVYKKNIDYFSLGETNYDFSTVKKLKARVKYLDDREKKYNKTIEEADKLYKQEDLVLAREFYNKAIGILDKPWPKEQLAKINKILKKQKRKRN